MVFSAIHRASVSLRFKTRDVGGCQVSQNSSNTFFNETKGFFAFDDYQSLKRGGAEVRKVDQNQLDLTHIGRLYPVLGQNRIGPATFRVDQIRPQERADARCRTGCLLQQNWNSTPMIQHTNLLLPANVLARRLRSCFAGFFEDLQLETG